MANHFFRFKQFTVWQEATAMKVCTDACIQGAYTARYLDAQEEPARRVLDIGTGTGLLSLMLAQELPAAQFTAVELDAAAAQQAAQNFAASPWAARLQALHADVRQLPVTAQYDFIITNPPFYEADLKSSSRLRNQAMHATTLDYTALLQAIAVQLAATGSFSILLPASRFPGFTAQAQAAGFYLQQALHVRQSPRHAFFRSVGIFRRTPATPLMEELVIHEQGNTYTPAFVALLKDFYLML